MWRWLTYRIFGVIAEILLLALVLHSIMWFLPGDAASLLLGTEAREDTLQAIQQSLGQQSFSMGNGQGFWYSFLIWITNWLQGDWGVSMTYAVPVSELLQQRLMVSLPLVVLALVLTLSFGLWGAFILFRLQKQWTKNLVNELAQISFAIPNFWLALILIYIFAVGLQWFPAGGFIPWTGKSPMATLHSLVLPVIALALPQAILTTRTLAKGLHEIAKRDFIRTAYAKGCTPSQVFYHHMLPMAVVAMLTLVGFQIIYFLAGTVVIEQVFHLPGIGKLLIQATSQRDLVLLKATIMMMMVVIIIVFSCIDACIHLLNPRLRYPVPALRSFEWY